MGIVSSAEGMDDRWTGRAAPDVRGGGESLAGMDEGATAAAASTPTPPRHSAIATYAGVGAADEAKLRLAGVWSALGDGGRGGWSV